MIIAYRAANTADAHLIRQMLEAEGIPAFIQGEYLQGAVGELPANTEIFVRVSDDNYDAARAVVAEWESGEPVVFDDDADDHAPAVAVPTAKQAMIRNFLLLVAVVVAGSLAMILLRRLAEG
jgi:Putative prokaryotic signal transducing protein